jgi:6-pyruvoyltetrahydropterin/6-carboxytetrahydropterin synthase
MSLIHNERFGIKVDKQYFNFCAAHFLIFEDGTREPLHGHNYHVTVELEGGLNQGDLVMDFIPFKPVVKELCDAMDHCTILPTENEKLQIRQSDEYVEVEFDGKRFQFAAEDVRMLPLPNTSTECLARFIGQELTKAIKARFPDTTVSQLKIAVSESPGQAGWYSCSL